MKLLKGFGKKYFTLCAIQAHSLATQLHSVHTSAKKHLNNKLLISNENDEDEDAPPDIVFNLISVLVVNKKSYLCECFFKKRTALALTLFRFIPRCPFYNTFFAFRRTGVHPPFA